MKMGPLIFAGVLAVAVLQTLTALAQAPAAPSGTALPAADSSAASAGSPAAAGQFPRSPTGFFRGNQEGLQTAS